MNWFSKLFGRRKEGLPENKKIKVGIIGFGGMAGYHYGKMIDSGLFTPYAAYDIKPERLKAAKLKGMIAYNSAEELLADKNISVVLVATPNDVHEKYTVMACNAGKNVICEKPVTLSSESLQRMIEAAKANGVHFVVHQNRRWDSDYLTVKNLVEDARLGGVYKIESQVVGSHGIPGEWRAIKAKGGGMLLDWGVHLIDQALNITDSPVIGVTARFSFVYNHDCDDGIDVIIDYANGFQYRVVVDTNTFVELPRWVVYGKAGTAIIKDWAQHGEIISCKVWKDENNKGIVAGNGFTKTMAKRSKNTVVHHKLPKEHGDWMVFYKGYYDMLVNGKPQLVSHESVMRCMKVMEACFKSAEEHKRIDVNI